ncbi:MAG: hypothetical protein EOP00_09400 [Pedobacter sp.]|nr:MAG: hypothetical protein EOP00_09400 [Pedobacter sp.]
MEIIDLKNVYFISESIPHDGYASSVIFYRHLERFKKSGHRIFVIIPNYANLENTPFYNDIHDKFTILKVPLGKWWLFPYNYKNAVSRTIRFSLLYLLFRSTLLKFPPSFIITYFYGEYLNGFASFLKSIFKCKMGTFLHDDKHLLNNTDEKNHKKYDLAISKASSVIWSVSEKLKIPGSTANNYLVIPPIPEGIANSLSVKWKDDFYKPVIGFSGTLYQSYIPIFKAMAEILNKKSGKIKIISKYEADLKVQFKAYPNIEIIPFFDKNIDAILYLRDNCSALFCGYPNDLQEMPWIYNCFPSKFVEFSHTKLPIILSGPISTSLADWAITNNWQLFTANLTNESITGLIDRISNQTDWENNAKNTEKIAKIYFDPDEIHKNLEKSLD